MKCKIRLINDDKEVVFGKVLDFLNSIFIQEKDEIKVPASNSSVKVGVSPKTKIPDGWLNKREFARKYRFISDVYLQRILRDIQVNPYSEGEYMHTPFLYKKANAWYSSEYILYRVLSGGSKLVIRKFFNHCEYDNDLRGLYLKTQVKYKMCQGVKEEKDASN